MNTTFKKISDFIYSIQLRNGMFFFYDELENSSSLYTPFGVFKFQGDLREELLEIRTRHLIYREQIDTYIVGSLVDVMQDFKDLRNEHYICTTSTPFTKLKKHIKELQKNQNYGEQQRHTYRRL